MSGMPQTFAISGSKVANLKREMNYLEARKLGPVSTLLYDKCLVGKDAPEERSHLIKALPAWANEMVVHRKKDKQFKKGEDVVDCETGWIFPASSIPAQAFGERGIALLLKSFMPSTNAKGKTIIEATPREIAMLNNFPKCSGWGIILDCNTTGIPTALSAKEIEAINKSNPGSLRWLERFSGSAIRPISRNATHDGRAIDLTANPEYTLGVVIAYNGQIVDGFVKQRLGELAAIAQSDYLELARFVKDGYAGQMKTAMNDKDNKILVLINEAGESGKIDKSLVGAANDTYTILAEYAHERNREAMAKIFANGNSIKMLIDAAADFSKQ